MDYRDFVQSEINKVADRFAAGLDRYAGRMVGAVERVAVAVEAMAKAGDKSVELLGRGLGAAVNVSATTHIRRPKKASPSEISPPEGS